MKDLKIKRAINCLIAVAAIQALVAAYSVFSLIGLNSMIETGQWATGLRSFSFMFTIAQMVLTYFVIVDLKKDKAWAWLTALSLFLYSAPSFALPACIIGFISLIDEDVRSGFIKQLDIKI